MANQGLCHLGGCQHTSQGMFTFQVRRRADTGQHGGSHIAGQENDVSLLPGQVLCQLHSHRRFTAARTPPDRQNLIPRLIHEILLRLFRAVENTSFFEIQHLFHPALASCSCLRLLSLYCFFTGFFYCFCFFGSAFLLRILFRSLTLWRI